MSRSSWAVSSSSVASGTGGVSREEDAHVWAAGAGHAREELLGAGCVVALAPAGRRVSLDLVAKAQDAVHERLRPGRAAGNVDLDRHELVSGHQRVVVEDTG